MKPPCPPAGTERGLGGVGAGQCPGDPGPCQPLSPRSLWQDGWCPSSSRSSARTRRRMSDSTSARDNGDVSQASTPGGGTAPAQNPPHSPQSPGEPRWKQQSCPQGPRSGSGMPPHGGPGAQLESEAALQGRVAQKLCRGQIMPEPCRALLSPWSIKNLTSDTETTEMNPEGGTGEEQKPLSTGHCPD